MNHFVIEKIEGPRGVIIPKDAVGGEFTSSSPLGASKKAFSRIYRKMGKPQVAPTFMIYLRKKNTTDLRIYEVSREVLSPPRVFERDGVPIVVEYSVVSKYMGIEKTASVKKTSSPKKKAASRKKKSPKKSRK